MRGTRWSEGVAKLALWLSGLVDFAQAAEVLGEVGQIHISASSVWRVAQQWGEQFRALEEQSEAPAAGRQAESARRMGVSMDGVMVNIRQEGWKEVKVGCVFEVALGPAPDGRTGELVELAHAEHNSYVAHLGGPERFGELLWAEARRRGWEHAADSQVVADAAAWVWNTTTTYFYDSEQVVDWYHATEHLSTAAEIVYGVGTPAARRCFRKWETPLYQGQARELAEMLTTLAAERPALGDALRREAGYFANNHRRMRYLEMREAGWLIGSGMVESGGKQFKTRFSAAGMRWSRTGAERLLPVRAAILSNHFDASWQRAYHSPPN